ncbi:uncharacterized protein LOC112659361 isoform X6 [Canis lupus dingo]|uniref:uncharacterized protein LOC112659361 isoform X6 n=1 Tax=Canis lupus dingo TaxID=286419 RepID=UPI0020C4E456|nr:uncharacterized protein LOC112659361 isoform X6 [Canis lupus dingo]
MRDPRGKPHRAVKRRGKAGGQGAPCQARVHGRWYLEPRSRGAQMLREKLWVPWNGLIVIGKRMELLGRNTQKPRMWDPKLDSEDWGLEDVEKTVLKAKLGQNQERMDVKLLHSVASALQASAGLRKSTAKELWGKEDVRGKIDDESEIAGTTEGSRRGSGFKEKLKFTGVGTKGGDLRSRPHTLPQNEEMLRSSGEKLSREKLRSSGEMLRSSGEKLRSSGEKLRSSGEKLRSNGEKLSGEKLRSSGEKLSLSEEILRSSGEKQGSRGEKLESSGNDLRSTGDQLQSSVEKLEDSGMGSINEETDERVVEVAGDEKLIKVTDAEMEIPLERVEGSDEELEGTKGAVVVEEDVLGGVNDTADESVSMEEREVIDEGDSE